MAVAYIGLGSNLGDRMATLTSAAGRLAGCGAIISGGPVFESDPVGEVPQGPFLNSVLGIETDLDPRSLLDALLSIEGDHGRVRDVRWGPRTLDLDILSYDGARIAETGLTIPHPEIRNRRFVLVPLLSVEPALGDTDGPYAVSLDAVEHQAMRRVTGPFDPRSGCWLTGIEDAIAFTEEAEGRFRFTAHRDWANSTGAAFGAYLSTASLFAVRTRLPALRPVSVTHRFVAPVAAGSEVVGEVDVVRRGRKSAVADVWLRTGGRVAGHTAVGLVEAHAAVERAPAAPVCDGPEATRPLAELIPTMGFPLGSSAYNWSPLENWQRPSLSDDDDGVLRLWSPNIGLGGDAYASAAAVTVPVDAAVWPATLHDMGRLPDGPPVSTPTVEYTAHMATDASGAPFHIVESSVVHRTATSVLGMIRVWDAAGNHLGSGRSLNLIRDQRPPADG